MVKLRRWEIPGCVYHVSFPTRWRRKLLSGIIADYIAVEILKLDSLDDCHLLAWCIMPEHVHLLIQPPDGKISKVVKRVEGRSGKKFSPYFPDMDKFWEARYWDLRLRSFKQIETECLYIENNPIRRGLCERPEDWRWSSAHIRHFGRVFFHGSRNLRRENPTSQMWAYRFQDALLVTPLLRHSNLARPIPADRSLRLYVR